MVSLKKIIPILTVAPLMATLTFTELLASFNRDKTVHELSMHWMRESVNQIKSQVRINLRKPEMIHKLSLNRYQSNPSVWNDPQSLTLHFYNQIRLFSSINNIYFGYSNRDFVGVEIRDNGQFSQSYAGKETDYQLLTYTLSREGQRGEIINQNPVFDTTTRPWYQAAEKNNDLVWSSVYPDFTTRQLAITAAQAVRDRQGNLVGVVAVDYFLNSIHEFLRDLSISKAAKVLIIQQNGQFIASSDPDPLTVLDPESETHLMMTESPDPIIQGIAETLIREFSDFSLISEAQSLIFVENNQRYLVWVEPIESPWNLNWVVIVILSESDVFNSGQNKRVQIFLIVTAIIGSLLAVWNMHQLVVSPLLRLNKTAKKLKNQKFKPEKNIDLVKRNDEMGQFSRVFEEMALLIQERQIRLEQRIEALSSYQDRATLSSSEDSENAPELKSSYWDKLKQKAQRVRQDKFYKKHG
ncbi:PDC sensor domain-containing protein [Roseofilum capinflatum]|uniref:Cache domain-containing protein n=1 Tax=Roseofilum capinflatum BLCC-M114 TaxID=3022440 RepID=A0ABT7BAM5_9CYAN|nr:cache domain-containing protein [Roseofilum capinflatum]MDJ1176238.1 cache domain-containing protein [Roseofilum capinflatum BLCC-M114]